LPILGGERDYYKINFFVPKSQSFEASKYMNDIYSNLSDDLISDDILDEEGPFSEAEEDEEFSEDDDKGDDDDTDEEY